MAARKFHFGSHDQQPSRMHRRGTPPVQCVVDIDYAEAEMRMLARAIERREARMGSDDFMDPFDFTPVDLT